MGIDDLAQPQQQPPEGFYPVECMGVYARRPKHVFYRNKPLAEKSTGLCKGCLVEGLEQIPGMTKDEKERILRDTYDGGILEWPDTTAEQR